MELPGDRVAPGDPRECREDARVPRDEEDAGLPEMKPDVPPSLRDAVQRDLRPTRPLRPPFVRALVLIPLAVAIVISVPGLRFFRPDMAAIGFLKAWGFSFGQALAGLVIVAVALRESIPGRGLSRRAIAATFVIGLAIPLVLLAATASAYNVGP